MIKSMTGFGRNKYETNSREYLVEIKSVNNRYNDVNIKMPYGISYLEEKVKKLIASSISRGKVDVYISFTNNTDTGKQIKFNIDLAKAYLEGLNKLAEETGVENDINLRTLSKFPEVCMVKNNEDDEEEIWKELEICIREALSKFILMRETEGAKMKDDLRERILRITPKIDEIAKLSSGLVNEYIEKLENRLKEMLKNNVVDESRIAQEIVIYSDKCSIEEELTRLKSHISQFLTFLEVDYAVGKKMDFLIQEINREINTIGSKANSLQITNLVVDLKTEMENIREQVQNIE